MGNSVIVSNAHKEEVNKVSDIMGNSVIVNKAYEEELNQVSDNGAVNLADCSDSCTYYYEGVRDNRYLCEEVSESVHSEFVYQGCSGIFGFRKSDVCDTNLVNKNKREEVEADGKADGLREEGCDWFSICGSNGGHDPDVVYICEARDTTRGSDHQVSILIYKSCIKGNCSCIFRIDGCRVQFKPCRVIVEAMLRGDNDPDWNYVVHGACFGFNVIDGDCDSCYDSKNYASITAEDRAHHMSIRLKKEIQSELVTIVDSPCVCTHALGAVSKGESDFRAIVDCSMPEGTCVNGFTDSCRAKFTYNSVESVTNGLQSGDYMATIDIKDAYRSISIHPRCREKQGLVWDFGDGITYLRDNRLCMGLSSSPYVFSKISDFVVRCLVREGYTECINYLDDYCVTARSRLACIKTQSVLVSILRRLGFYISYKKLVYPEQTMRFLGIDIDSVEMQLRLPADKIEKLKDILKTFLRKKKASKKELESLGGLLAHACKVVHGGRTFSRRVYDMLSKCRGRNYKVRLNEDFREDLYWWLDYMAVFNGKTKIIPTDKPVIAMYSDSSRKGFGALYGADWIAGTFQENKDLKQWLGHHWADADDKNCDTDNINVLEMWPVLKGVEKWGPEWRDKTIIVVTDNTQVRAALNTGRSTNKTTMRWLRKIFWCSIMNNFDIQSVYINTKNNVICDSLSRLDAFKNIARIRDVDVMGRMCCHTLFLC